MKNSINKSDLTKRVSGITGMTARDVEWIISEFVHQVLLDITGGARVQIHELGTFEKFPVEARAYRNPGTGEVIEKSAGFRVRFRPSSRLKHQ